MPLAFAAILGGLVTLIGTPPNIIVAAYRAEVAGEAFARFDFAPVGLPVAAFGVLLVSFIGWGLIPRFTLRDGLHQELSRPIPTSQNFALRMIPPG